MTLPLNEEKKRSKPKVCRPALLTTVSFPANKSGVVGSFTKWILISNQFNLGQRNARSKKPLDGAVATPISGLTRNA